MNNDEFVLNFFLGIASDSKGRSIHDILAFNEQDIESTHDFIQYIFPTYEKSAYNHSAPIISSEFKYLLNENRVAQENFCKTCQLFLIFCGFECPKSSESFVINLENNFVDKPKHNLLRITRVLNSLNQIGKESCSRKIYKQIKIYTDKIPNQITDETYSYWDQTQKQ